MSLKPIAATLMCLLIVSLSVLAFVRSITVLAEEQAPEIEWIRKFGSPMTDRAEAVAAGPQGEVYVSG